MNKKSILSLVITVIVLVGGSSLVMIGMGACSNQNNTFDRQLMRTASELNSNCPIMVDSETRLDNAVALPGMTFQYNYTLINFSKEQMDVDHVKAAMYPSLLNNVKSNDGLKSFRDNTVTLKYSYSDKNGVFLFLLVVRPEDYR